MFDSSSVVTSGLPSKKKKLISAFWLVRKSSQSRHWHKNRHMSDRRLPKVWFGLVWLFWFNGPLRQYFSLYRAVSQREGGREEKREESKNV